MGPISAVSHHSTVFHSGGSVPSHASRTGSAPRVTVGHNNPPPAAPRVTVTRNNPEPAPREPAFSKGNVIAMTLGAIGLLVSACLFPVFVPIACVALALSLPPLFLGFTASNFFARTIDYFFNPRA